MFRVKEKNGKETQFGQFLGSSLGTGNVLFSVLTSFGILSITCSILIRFELFKFLVTIDF